MSKVALVIVYNHPHVENVEVLERIYRDRFSDVFHLMPFYEGNKPNVIPVYGSGFLFQGFLAQGYNRYFAKEHRHYIFIADDLCLNPIINEENYMEYFGLDDGSCFIKDLMPLREKKDWGWTWADVVGGLTWRPLKTGIYSIDNQLPSYDEALKKMEKLGLTMAPLRMRNVLHSFSSPARWGFISEGKYLLFVKCFVISLYRQFHAPLIPNIKMLANIIMHGRVPRTPFPFVYGYSDICIVSSKHIRKFAHYCGFFAASHLFVEIALPTSLALCVEPEECVTENDIPFLGGGMWEGKDIEDLAKRYRMRLEALLADFPKNCLYLHPVKLSQWK